MGQTWSGQTDEAPVGASIDTQLATASSLLSPFEKLSLKKWTNTLENDADALTRLLGIEGAPGSGIMLRLAQALSDNNIERNLAVVVTCIDGRLSSATGEGEYAWRRRLFEAISHSEVDTEAYLAYSDAVALWQLLLSAFDWAPRDFSRSKVDLIEPRYATQLLSKVKAPALLFDQFNEVLNEQPFLLASLANIWDRLLYDPESTKTPAKAPPSAITQSLSRAHVAVLNATLGPRILSAIRLFQGTKDGFSMRGFEVGVTKWPAASILLVRGHQPHNFAKSWESKHKEIDQLMPRFYDAPLRPARDVLFAIFVDEPWKASYKHSFGSARTLLLQLEPQYHVYRVPAKRVFLAPKVGFGVGFAAPPSTSDRSAGETFLVDSSMKHGVFRSLSDSSDKYEFRFFVDQVEVLGCGTAADLAQQQRAWEWEEKAAERRRNVNSQEDRAILEMAGIVGQYE